MSTLLLLHLHILDAGRLMLATAELEMAYGGTCEGATRSTISNILSVRIGHIPDAWPAWLQDSELLDNDLTSQSYQYHWKPSRLMYHPFRMSHLNQTSIKPEATTSPLHDAEGPGIGEYGRTTCYYLVLWVLVLLFGPVEILGRLKIQIRPLDPVC